MHKLNGIMDVDCCGDCWNCMAVMQYRPSLQHLTVAVASELLAEQACLASIATGALEVLPTV